MSDEGDGGTCVVCGVALDDGDSWWVELMGPEDGEELHTCSQDHAAEAVASWAPRPRDDDGAPESEIGDTVATVVLLVVLLALLGLVGLGGYQLLQLVGLV